MEYKPGDRVRIKDTLMYNGRTGTISSDTEIGFWDFHVDLDAAEVPDPNPFAKATKIGVVISQIEPE